MTKKIVGRLAAALMAGLIAVTSCGFTQIASAASEEEPEKYTISLEQTSGGSLKFKDLEETELAIAAGEEITILALPDEGFNTENVKASDNDGRELILTADEAGYHLVMPESDVRVTPVFSQVMETIPDVKTETEPVLMETEAEDENEGLAEGAGEGNVDAVETGAGDEPSREAENTVQDAETVTQPEGSEPETVKESDEKAEMPEAEETAVRNESKDPEKDDKTEVGDKEVAEDENAEVKEEKEDKPAEMQWSSLSSDEVDAMVGMTSARKRMLLRASATTIYEGAMNRFYGAATPHLYDSNGNLVYCILPWSASPNGVNVSFNDYNITSASDGNQQLMAKLMYYGYGGGGNILGGYSAADQEAITHFALSYVWMIYMGNTHGYGDWTSSGGSNLDGTGQAIVLNFLSQVQGMPAVTGTLHVAGLYEASGEVYQDLAYGNFTPEVRNGKLTLSKTSAIPKITNDNACYSLEGAVYGVYSDSGCTSKVGQLTTNANGKATAALELKEGSYYVKEITPSKGYFLDSTVYTCKVTSDTTAEAKVTEVPGNDPVTLILLKRDSETGTAQRGLKLSGAEYTVKYYDVNSDTDPAADGKKPVKTWVFKTDEKGRVLLDDAHLVSGDAFYYSDDKPVFPLGTITIKETKAPKGYVKDSKVYVANTVRKTNTSVVTSNLPNSETKNSKEDIIRGDLKFYKIDAATRKSMSGIPFKITAQSTGESHVIVSDKNGLVSTAASDVPHTQNTNKGRSSEDGIWFGSGDPDNSKGALYYDTYTVEEQPCAANYGKDLVSFEVTIEKNNQTVEYGSVNNLNILIHTTARDGATGTKTVAAEKNAAIIDTVAYENLTVGRTYVLKGRLMDQSTGKELKVGGKSITAEESFTPKSAKGTVKMTFTLDASGLEGKTLVVFEELYWNGTKIADHEDIEDDDQAVFVPSVKTTATDSETKDHTGAAEGKTTIIDKVVYTGLTPGKTYHLKGVVMDKETGEPLVQNGKEIAAEMDFAPGKSNGTVELKVSFDASLLAGKTVVIFETVTYKGRNVAMHTDITDEDQTVHYPEIHTSAVDKDTKDNVGTVSEKAVIIDTVSYSNLITGKEYTVKGTLMDQKTGKALLINGKAVTAEKTFKPEKAEGTVEIEFSLDASALQGTSVVVFEDLYHNDVKVTAHADIKDEGQTIHYPEIKTSAADSHTKDNQGIAAKKVTIVDTVSYTNLIVGKEYTVKGKLMNQETGKALLVNGKAVTAEKTFTAEKTDGTIVLEFTLNSEAVNGKTTVVFEELYHSDVKVTVHADITDKDQTVHIPEIHTNAVDGSTKTHIGEVS
ncbi:MAG: VaFE repeat-containing surface-anchored protein [Lachnospiraceae bacterium]|nr:VaFE repeat-containing surface-anchored protein [Lachnospiraceae bacterium]